jgi:hypothetical protein
MAWDSSRTVPWRRLIREWLIYVAVAAAAIVVYFLVTDKQIDVGLFTGLLVSGPAYIAFGALLAKFGYNRKTFKDLRAERPAAGDDRRGSDATGTSAATAIRTLPAPTKRTSTGPQHRKPKRR